MTWRILIGDCREQLAELPAASIDAVVTDPPYGLEFMGQDWDAPWKHGFTATGYSDGSPRPPRPNFGSTRNPMCRTCRKHQRGTDSCACATPNFDERPADSNRAFQAWVETWAIELLRVLKPGGHALVFGGTRTYHRLASGLEDAGFEIRDCIAWMYGSGFPKSLDVSKAVDARLGVEGGYGEVKSARAGINVEGRAAASSRKEGWDRPWKDDPEAVDRNARVYEPGSDEARRWAGWGTALKPAYEPIVVARKPLAGTVAATVLAHGTGALNIDGCRVAMSESDADAINAKHAGMGADAYERAPGASLRLSTDPIGLKPAEAHVLGRWPANVALGHSDGCVRVGEASVGADGHWPAARPAGSALAGAAGHGGQDGIQERHAAGERVAVWDCEDGCPVRALDEQTGDVGGGFGRRGALNGGATQWGFVGDGRDVGYGDSGGASRFFYTAKASTAERHAGLVLCSCETSPAWVNEDQQVRIPPATDTRPTRDTTASTTRSSADTASRTSSHGSESTELSPTDSRSTTKTETSRTTTSPTSDSSPTSTTSESTRPTTDEASMENGSDGAPSAASGSQQRSRTSTSPEKDGSLPDAVDPATSERSSSRSNSDALWCPNCGGLRGGHPTVKPVAIMRWLVRLVTPPGGLVADPFTGSGTTGIACALEGFDFVGVEQSPEYAAIAAARIAYWDEHGEDALRVAETRQASERDRQERADAGQLDLFAERP